MKWKLVVEGVWGCAPRIKKSCLWGDFWPLALFTVVIPPHAQIAKITHNHEQTARLLGPHLATPFMH